MHLTTKEVIATKEQADKLKLSVGTHIITTVVEADGPNALASKDATFDFDVISVQRTDSGGVQVQVALEIKEPAPVADAPKAPPPVVSTQEEQAVSYFVEKGFTEKDAAEQVSRFGVSRVLATREAELDKELASIVTEEK